MDIQELQQENEEERNLGLNTVLTISHPLKYWSPCKHRKIVEGIGVKKNVFLLTFFSSPPLFLP